MTKFHASYNINTVWPNARRPPRADGDFLSLKLLPSADCWNQSLSGYYYKVNTLTKDQRTRMHTRKRIHKMYASICVRHTQAMILGGGYGK